MNLGQPTKLSFTAILNQFETSVSTQNDLLFTACGFSQLDAYGFPTPRLADFISILGAMLQT